MEVVYAAYIAFSLKIDADLLITSVDIAHVTLYTKVAKNSHYELFSSFCWRVKRRISSS